MRTIDTTDPLLAYCIALDAHDFARVASICEQSDGGLLDAITALHLRFGHDETWTKQLLRERQRYQEEQ